MLTDWLEARGHAIAQMGLRRPAWTRMTFGQARERLRTLPVGISLYQGEFTFPWPVISAALVVAIVPIAVLIAAFQERVVGGLTQGGLKG